MTKLSANRVVTSFVLTNAGLAEGVLTAGIVFSMNPLVPIADHEDHQVYNINFASGISAHINYARNDIEACKKYSKSSDFWLNDFTIGGGDDMLSEKASCESSHPSENYASTSTLKGTSRSIGKLYVTLQTGLAGVISFKRGGDGSLIVSAKDAHDWRSDIRIRMSDFTWTDMMACMVRLFRPSARLKNKDSQIMITDQESGSSIVIYSKGNWVKLSLMAIAPEKLRKKL